MEKRERRERYNQHRRNSVKFKQNNGPPDLSKYKSERRAEREKVRNMTEEELLDYTANPKPHMFDYLKRETDDIAALTPKKTFRQIFSNWVKYEMPNEEELDDYERDEEKYGANFNTLIHSLPVDNHFRFKSEKDWNVTTPISCNEVFNLNLNTLEACLSCIPFYEQIDLSMDYFSKEEVERMDNHASLHTTMYQNMKKTSNRGKSKDNTAEVIVPSSEDALALYDIEESGESEKQESQISFDMPETQPEVEGAMSSNDIKVPSFEIPSSDNTQIEKQMEEVKEEECRVSEDDVAKKRADVFFPSFDQQISLSTPDRVKEESIDTNVGKQNKMQNLQEPENLEGRKSQDTRKETTFLKEFQEEKPVQESHEVKKNKGKSNKGKTNKKRNVETERDEGAPASSKEKNKSFDKQLEKNEENRDLPKLDENKQEPAVTKVKPTPPADTEDRVPQQKSVPRIPEEFRVNATSTLDTSNSPKTNKDDDQLDFLLSLKKPVEQQPLMFAKKSNALPSTLDDDDTQSKLPALSETKKTEELENWLDSMLDD